jgi:hypothetical protein
MRLLRDSIQVPATGKVLSIDASDPCFFTAIRSFARLDNGGFLLADGPSRLLCTFDRQGNLTAVGGAKGQGPGEFMSLSMAQPWTNDSVLVYDATLRRLSVFSPSLRYVRTLELKIPAGVSNMLVHLSSLSNHAVMAGFADFRGAVAGPDAVAATQQLLLFGPEGEVLRRVGVYLENEKFVRSVPPQFGGVAYGERAFSRRLAVVSLPGEFAIGDGGVRTFELQSNDGRRKESITDGLLPEAVSAADRERFRNIEVARASMARRALVTDEVNTMPFPRTYPAYRKALSGEGRIIWVERYPRPGSLHEVWTRWDVEARTSRAFVLPPRFQARFFERGLACGVSADEDDVLQLACFRLPVER